MDGQKENKKLPAFIPEWNDNRTKATDNPKYKAVKFYLRPIDGYDQDIFDMIVAQYSAATKSDHARMLAALQREWVINQVERIDNLKTSSGPVMTGKEFVEQRGNIPSGRVLFWEVVAEIGKQNGVVEEEAKN